MLPHPGGAAVWCDSFSLRVPDSQGTSTPAFAEGAESGAKIRIIFKNPNPGPRNMAFRTIFSHFPRFLRESCVPKALFDAASGAAAARRQLPQRPPRQDGTLNAAKHAASSAGAASGHLPAATKKGRAFTRPFSRCRQRVTSSCRHSSSWRPSERPTWQPSPSGPSERSSSRLRP